MIKLRTNSKIRKRRKLVQSNQRIISWARKQKHKTLLQTAAVPSKLLPICPLIGCSGSGHVNGVDVSHVTLPGCPTYHNLAFEKWTEMRAREEGLVSPMPPNTRKSSPLTSPIKSTKQHHPSDLSHQLRTLTKEPPLDDLCSPMEIYQFRCAQQRLVLDKEREAKEHLILCARIASQQADASGQFDCSHQALSRTSTIPSCTTEHTGTALEQRIQAVQFGDWKIEPTYQSAYPPDIACLPVIYVCEYCLTPMRHDVSYARHRHVCTWRFPPGDEIYRKNQLSFFELDGEKHPDYCRNLCLLTKLFLKHKTVHEIDQVPSFLFYILTDFDEEGFHIVGYFSKQKPEDPHETGMNSVAYNNLSCILTLPQYQFQGYGRTLIEMSYILSLMENRIGSPERPLSDAGLILYRKYWKWEILNYLISFSGKTINIRTMSMDTGIAIPDIVSTLLDMKMLAYFRTQYYIISNKTEVNRMLINLKIPDPSKRIDKTCLRWIPHSIAPTVKSTRDKTTVTSSNTSK